MGQPSSSKCAKHFTKNSTQKTVKPLQLSYLVHAIFQTNPNIWGQPLYIVVTGFDLVDKYYPHLIGGFVGLSMFYSIVSDSVGVPKSCRIPNNPVHRLPPP